MVTVGGASIMCGHMCCVCLHPPASWESTKVTGEGSCETVESRVSSSLRMCSVREGGRGEREGGKRGREKSVVVLDRKRRA